ncbi:MAG: 3-methyl-2-oxobutanoate dehydrogenase subunit beta, partial [Bacteroidales bacterium]|nr:3-methyl-2-oxobutanoate dehydrogenase subunit beta [Bacteroidales bacterium]
PSKRINELADKTRMLLTVEMSAGQMVEDVMLAVSGKKPVHFYGRMGGMIPSPDEVVEKLKELINA